MRILNYFISAFWLAIFIAFLFGVEPSKHVIAIALLQSSLIFLLLGDK